LSDWNLTSAVRDACKKIVERNSILLGRANRLIQGHDVHVGRGPDPLMALLDAQRIGVVLDVGANTGQYARNLRILGYRERIISFEPSSAAFAALSRVAQRDDNRSALQLALGTEQGSATMNVYKESVFNSLRPLVDPGKWNERQPTTETVRVERLDAIFDTLVRPDDRVFLKIDTQGTERDVLEGGAKVLDRIAGLQLEISFSALYEGEPLFSEMVAYAAGFGYTLVCMLPLHHALTRAQRRGTVAEIVQADAVFLRL
jgi:FkbM family methyltransferase